MRLGGPIFIEDYDSEQWALAHRELGYSAAYAPAIDAKDESSIKEYIHSSQKHNLIIAEVGAWSNPISKEDETRKNAITHCQERLSFADRMGALCCVNIAGSRGEKWDGPYADNLTEDTFALIVDTVREIIDAVKPSRTFYTLETMPWVFPDSVDNYLRLIRAIDRKSFAVHLDPVNLINSPSRYFQNGDMIAECFAKLGPYIKSCHAKDIIMGTHLTVHLDEVRPGLGAVEYKVFLQQLSRISKDTPLMLEHLSNAQDYILAAQYIRQIASNEGITID